MKENNKKMEHLKNFKYIRNLEKETEYKTNYMINRIKKNLNNEK